MIPADERSEAYEEVAATFELFINSGQFSEKLSLEAYVESGPGFMIAYNN